MFFINTRHYKNNHVKYTVRMDNQVVASYMHGPSIKSPILVVIWQDVDYYTMDGNYREEYYRPARHD